MWKCSPTPNTSNVNLHIFSSFAFLCTALPSAYHNVFICHPRPCAAAVLCRLCFRQLPPVFVVLETTQVHQIHPVRNYNFFFLLLLSPRCVIIVCSPFILCYIWYPVFRLPQSSALPLLLGAATNGTHHIPFRRVSLLLARLYVCAHGLMIDLST